MKTRTMVMMIDGDVEDDGNNDNDIVDARTMPITKTFKKD